LIIQYFDNNGNSVVFILTETVNFINYPLILVCWILFALLDEK